MFNFCQVARQTDFLRPCHVRDTLVLPPPENFMHRLIRIGSIGSIALAAFVAMPQTSAAQVVPPYSGVNINVDIQCLPGNAVSFTLAPWNAQVPLGDSVSWSLNQDAGVSEITISSKQTAWPFTSAPPYKGNAARKPKARGMKSGVKVGDRYSYAVMGVCTRADGSTNTVIIDPDMIIIPGK